MKYTYSILGVGIFASIIGFFYVLKPDGIQHPQYKGELTPYSGSLFFQKITLLTGGEQVQTLAEISGKRAKLLAYPGDQVKGGQPILQLKDDVANYQSQAEYVKLRLDQSIQGKDEFIKNSQKTLTQTKTLMDNAKNNFEHLQSEREQHINDKDNVIDKTLHEAEKHLKEAGIAYELFMRTYSEKLADFDEKIAEEKEQYESLLTQYAKLTLRAPVSGILGDVLEKEDINRGDLVFTILRPTKQLNTVINTNEYLILNQDAPVYIKTNNLTLTGAITSILPTREKSETFELMITTTESINTNGEVARILLPIKQQNWIKIPSEFLFTGQNNQPYFSFLSGSQVITSPVNIKAKSQTNTFISL